MDAGYALEPDSVVGRLVCCRRWTSGGLQLTPTLQAGVCELALTVHPGARRQGVATALLQYVAETRTDTNLKALVCENGHPAVMRMAKTLGWGLRLREEAPRVWLELPTHRC